MGGDLQGKELFYTSLDALVHHSDAPQNTSIWVSTFNGPHMHSSLVVFGNQLMSVGGEDAESSIYAYQQKDQSWHFKGIMPTDVQNACTATLLTGELVLIGGTYEDGTSSSQTFTATLQGMHTSSRSQHP